MELQRAGSQRIDRAPRHRRVIKDPKIVFIAFGMLGAALTGAVTGAVVGGITAALVDFSGIPEQDARDYEAHGPRRQDSGGGQGPRRGCE